MPNFVYKNNMIEYQLSRNAKRNVNFRIKGDGTVCVSAPQRISNRELSKLLNDKAEWIIENRNNIINKKHNSIDKEIKTGNHVILNGKRYALKVIKGDSNCVYVHERFLTIQIKEKYVENQEYINNFFENWLREIILEISNKFVDKYLNKLKKYNLKKPELSIRDMNSRWGSCIPAKNKIIISKNLIYPPFECLEYVVLHEVSHLIEPNHSKNFYNIIASVMPDWEVRRKMLNEF